MFVLMAALEEERAERLPDGLRFLLLREGVLVVEERVGASTTIGLVHCSSCGEAGAASRRWRALRVVLRLPPPVARARVVSQAKRRRGEIPSSGVIRRPSVWTSRTLKEASSTSGEG